MHVSTSEGAVRKQRSVCHRTDGGMQKSLNKTNGGCLTILFEGGRREGVFMYIGIGTLLIIILLVIFVF